ncbi:hypothetical protein GCM10009775_06860 [Microbacterium aoyamense]|uniref:Flagellar biosynthesis protein, FliO n=1 Tax=Microbacterium aoyamense TaxID=344166 RepID=A0ABP5ALF5_9MICO|nr:flagellar biosynthetic protein FliO [Microbacterium aoyamense]
MEDLLIAVRAIVSLAAVLGLLLWLTHRIKKRQSGGAGRGALTPSLKKLSALIPLRPAPPAAAPRPERITVVARSGLSSKAQLVVAEFGGIRYVLGVTEHGVSVVDTQEAAPAWDADADASADRESTSLKPVA